MTIKEYLTATLSKFQISETDINLLMLNQGLDDSQPLNVTEVEIAIYNEFSSLLPLMDVSEGTMSIKWNMATLKLWYSMLAKKLGKEDVFNELSGKDVEVTDKSYLF